MRNLVASEPREADNEINLTPMLDVVFIMLIFFIVTASFIREVGIPVDRPGDGGVVSEVDNILVTIDQDSRIWIGNRSIDPRAVRPNIERMIAENPGARVIVLPDQHSLNDTLVQVMNASREAGVYDIALAEY